MCRAAREFIAQKRFRVTVPDALNLHLHILYPVLKSFRDKRLSELSVHYALASRPYFVPLAGLPCRVCRLLAVQC